MTPSKPIAVALAAMLTLTLFGGVAAATPDSLDCEDDSYGVMDNADDNGGGGDPDDDDDDVCIPGWTYNCGGDPPETC